MLTLDDLRRAGKGSWNKTNAQSFLVALQDYGKRFGLDTPHRIAQLVAQVLHETGSFRWDREIWGPTAAQKKYEGRKDLGNTQKGDGQRYMGRGDIQITGRYNYREFTEWCRKNIDPDCPDFEADPELINTDPWEGLVAIWYWDEHGLNKYADRGDIEQITKRINGGLNGYEDRIDYYARISLVLLGYPVDGLEEFQKAKGLKVDNDPGARTRSALHEALVNMTPGEMAKTNVLVAPVVEEKKVIPTEVKQLDKPLGESKTVWSWVGSIAGALGTSAAAWMQDWRVVIALSGCIIVLAVIGIVFHKQIRDAVRGLKGDLA